MIRIIAHRGNDHTPGIHNGNAYENRFSAIDACIEKNFLVEVDVWGMGTELYLGHDNPYERITPYPPKTWELREIATLERIAHLIFHAKNYRAAQILEDASPALHWFAHENDPYVRTSHGKLWIHPDHQPEYKTVGDPARDILCLPEQNRHSLEYLRSVWGICTDYPSYYRDLLNRTEEQSRVTHAIP